MTTSDGPTTELVTAMLRHFEWSPTSKASGRYEIWTLRGGQSDEVLVPLDPSRGDFEDLVWRALRQIRSRYGTEASHLEDLLRLTSNADLDSTQWKKQTSVDAGLISWIEGEGIYEAARGSLAAAARSVHAKRIQHGNAGAYLVQRFLEQTLMGQTEVGSFIVTAHIPATAKFHVSQRSENRTKDDYRNADQVSGRTILNAFTHAVGAVRQVLDGYKTDPRVEPFKDVVAEGVSFELLTSLATLTNGGDAAISVERAGDGPHSTEIEFDSVESPVLARAAADFAKVPPPEQVRLTGEVSLLDNSSAVPIHLIRLDVKSGSKVRRVRLRLTPEQYEVAISAHANHRWLRASGSLQKDGRDWWLYNGSDIHLVDPEAGPLSRPAPVFDESLGQDPAGTPAD